VQISVSFNSTKKGNKLYLDADKIKAIFLGNYTSKKRFSSSRSTVQQQAGANPQWTSTEQLWILQPAASQNRTSNNKE